MEKYLDYFQILKYFLRFIGIGCIFLFFCNLTRCVRISIYYSQYKNNCKSNNYRANISFHKPVTRLFNAANVNRVDLRNFDLISEHLNNPDYHNEICNSFERAKAVFKDRLFRPWYILFPKTKRKYKIINNVITFFKTLLLFLISQVFSIVLEASGIGNILWDIFVLKFPFLTELITHISHG